jgi:hypothetical protein
MLEELLWFLTWLLLLVLVHYQFKVCVPVTLACLKVLESLLLLFAVRVYVYFIYYGEGLNMDLLKNATSLIREHILKNDL